MSRIIISIFFLYCVSFSQNHSNFYNGELSFDFSGNMNGSFYANLIDPDSLSISSSGAFCLINSDSVLNRIFIPAFQPSENSSNSIDLFFLYMTDSGSEIEPQSWDVVTPDPNDPENTSATMLFIPEMDSTQVMDLIAPIINGEIDSTNFSDYLLETLVSLIGDSYLPLSGEITLDGMSESEMSGSFGGTLFQAGFPPPIITLSDGTFNLTAPAGQLQPSPPIDFSIDLVQDDAHLLWNFVEGDSLLNFTTVHKSTLIDSISTTWNIDIPYPEIEFFDTEVEPSIVYEYYLTVTNIFGLTSLPTDTLTFFIDSNILGDLNMDGNIDVLDIVSLVNFILETDIPNDYESWAGDMNSDGNLDVLDIVTIVNIILDEG